MLNRKYWIYRDHEQVHIDNLVKELNISEITARLLINRGFTDCSKAAVFLNSSLDDLNDPYLLKDMDRAVSKIKKAIDEKQAIWIYGDYDVDGISSTAVLIKYFNLINFPVNYYIPDRIEEGYGINLSAIEKIASEGGNLIITVDCGITAVKEVEKAKELGIDVIITDHHECQRELPRAIAIINPKQDGCNYPFKMPCGCGIAFKLIQALLPKEIFISHIDIFIDIVAIATIADMVPLTDENRIFVKYGLGIIENSNNLGIKMLVESCGLEGKKITAGHIGYMIAPRINAAGRISSPQNAVRLLITDDINEARNLAKLLSDENSKRQDMEAEIVEEALRIVESDKNYEHEKVLVISGDGWHHGVIGIVASRVVEKFHKPTIILAVEHGIAKGSARSISKFNLFKALESCGDLFLKFGGHEQAAGLTLLQENVQAFRTKINELANEILSEEDLIPEIHCDTELMLNNINESFIDELSNLEPYGIGNPTPQFYCINLKTKKINILGSDGKHIKIQFSEGNKVIESIGFNMGSYAAAIEHNNKIGAVFTPEFNFFNNKKTIQLKLKDIKLFSNTYTNEEIKTQYFNSFIEKKMVEDIKEVDLSTLNNYIHYYEDKDYFLVNYIYRAEGPLLIIVNTLEQASRIFKLMDIRQGSSSRVNIFFNNPIDNNRHKNTIDIIINPNIDKIQYKIYNNIIAYDFFFTQMDLITFITKEQSVNKIILYEKNDELSNERFIKSITPTRDKLTIVYKALRDNFNNSTVELSEIISYIKGQKFDINTILLNRSLVIFSEGNLIKDPFILGQKGYVSINIEVQKSKINIEDLLSYKSYIDCYNSFLNYKKRLLNHIEEERKWT
ncbi:single-stranded-DNA-specific exonuclease RecJ [Serpentinicella alkaliphila]|uniref:Single-stranded-DNA-specific exonuclease RecJ n=1 Tax=Serpentinicella alkaliphila TaxID=1734049 RepID=A0A4R2TXZ6_9FIRM|nr:single-stranded-DNA-specific exonuclease RecJ [Serpentinicella alkaliphila]QUH26730.1 single-stranded-DNA-specific exonuclease RecJ [Serpentinicella alkaliphila]TCQ07947.1 exonuclease RecJ [Serpentinicella alkaliphila]